MEWVELVARDCRLDVTNGPDGTLYFSDLARIFRETADYRTDRVDEIQARRALRKAQDLVGAVIRGSTSR